MECIASIAQPSNKKKKIDARANREKENARADLSGGHFVSICHATIGRATKTLNGENTERRNRRRKDFAGRCAA